MLQGPSGGTDSSGKSGTNVSIFVLLWGMRFALAGLLGAVCAWAQPIPAARGSHQTLYEDARVRIVEFQIAPGDSAGQRRLDRDYVWVADSEVHFSQAGTTHVEQNREIQVGLLQPQTGPRNVCAEVMAGEYLHCHEPGPEWLGANLEIEFETGQMRIGILQIAAEARLAVPPAEVPPLLIPLDGAETEAISRLNGAPADSTSRHMLKALEVLRSPADQVIEVRNLGKSTARFLVIEFGGAGE